MLDDGLDGHGWAWMGMDGKVLENSLGLDTLEQCHRLMCLYTKYFVNRNLHMYIHTYIQGRIHMLSFDESYQAL